MAITGGVWEGKWWSVGGKGGTSEGGKGKGQLRECGAVEVREWKEVWEGG
jgi:hypothetical protein